MALEHRVKVANDGNLHQRLTAEAAAQGIDNPEAWVAERRWKFAALGDWDNKYDSAEQNHIGKPIGTNPTVFTDADIAAGVAAVLAQDPPA